VRVLTTIRVENPIEILAQRREQAPFYRLTLHTRYSTVLITRRVGTRGGGEVGTFDAFSRTTFSSETMTLRHTGALDEYSGWVDHKIGNGNYMELPKFLFPLCPSVQDKIQ